MKLEVKLWVIYFILSFVFAIVTLAWRTAFEGLFGFRTVPEMGFLWWWNFHLAALAATFFGLAWDKLFPGKLTLLWIPGTVLVFIVPLIVASVIWNHAMGLVAYRSGYMILWLITQLSFYILLTRSRLEKAVEEDWRMNDLLLFKVPLWSYGGIMFASYVQWSSP